MITDTPDLSDEDVLAGVVEMYNEVIENRLLKHQPLNDQQRQFQQNPYSIGLAEMRNTIENFHESRREDAKNLAFAVAGDQIANKQATVLSPALVDCSEDTLALQFATQHEQRLCYTAGMDWRYFNGMRWEPDNRLLRYDYCRRLCRDVAAGLDSRQSLKTTAASTVSAVLNHARSDQRLVVDAEQWDADELKLNTPAGMVDLLTGDIRPTLHTDYVTRITEVLPNQNPAPNWEKFLQSVFLSDHEVIDFIQVMLGYCLTGSNREQKLFFFFGKGSNGKSTLLDLVEWILGDYSLKLPASVLMQSRHSTHPTELAQLQGRRLATSSEIEDGQYWAESRIKELTGDEMLSARFMRQDYFQFRQTQKHIILDDPGRCPMGQ